MNALEEKSVSLWMETKVPDTAPLDSDATADAAIIGSGIAGLSTA
jgi:hypothetical protein